MTVHQRIKQKIDEKVQEKVRQMNDDQIRAAARYAYEIMKHPMFGRFPKPPESEQPKPKRTKKTKRPPTERQFALKEDEE